MTFLGRLPALCAISALSIVCLASPAWARPLSTRTPLPADQAAAVPLRVLTVDMAQTVPSDLRRVQPELPALLAKELRRVGYLVPDAAPAASGGAPALEPALALGGRVTSYECGEVRGGTCAIATEWSLFHLATGAALYKLTTRHEEVELGRADENKAARLTVLGSLRSLLSRSRFQSTVAAPDASYETRLTAATLRACATPSLAMPADTEKVLSATAVVRTTEGVGSAVAISPDGYWLTAAHVVKDLEKDEITLATRGAKAMQARVIRYDESSDVALLKTAPLPGAQCLKLATDGAKAGEEVYVVGAPAGEELSFSMSRGILSGRRKLYGNEYLQTDASINPGNSGGPLLDGAAEVLGIVSWKLAGRALEGLGFAVEIHSALRSLSLEIGGEATTSLAKERAATNVIRAGMEDQEDGDWQVIGAPDAGSTKSRVSPAVVKTLRAGGWLGVLGGSTVLLVSALANDSGNLDGWVTAGAVLTGLGAGAVITSWILQPFAQPIGLQTSKQGGFELAGGRARLVPELAPTGVSLNVSYSLR